MATRVIGLAAGCIQELQKASWIITKPFVFIRFGIPNQQSVFAGLPR